MLLAKPSVLKPCHHFSLRDVARVPDYPDQWIQMEFVCECGTTCRIDVELLDGPFVGHAYQHCGTTTGRYVPGRVIKMWEGLEATNVS
jgi:hypothetical protein